MGYRQLENERPTPKQQCTYAPLPRHANRRARINRPGRPDRVSVATAQRHANRFEQPHLDLRARREPFPE